MLRLKSRSRSLGKSRTASVPAASKKGHKKGQEKAKQKQKKVQLTRAVNSMWQQKMPLVRPRKERASGIQHRQVSQVKVKKTH